MTKKKRLLNPEELLISTVFQINLQNTESLTEECYQKLQAKVGEVLKTLTYREREVIKLRYGLGNGVCYTLEEVGRIFKVTRERVRQIEAKAIAKLRHPVRSIELYGAAVECGISGIQRPQYRGEELVTSQEEIHNPLLRGIWTLNLSVRSRKALERMGIKTIGQLVEKTPQELIEQVNFGRTSLYEVREKLNQFNLRLKEDDLNSYRLL